MPQNLDTDTAPCGSSRRAFIRQAATLAGGAVVLAAGASVLTSCGLFAASAVRLGTPAELQEHGYLTAPLNDHETLWLGLNIAQQPYALLLTCTHKQCTVAWQPQQREFKCPCHQGRYDAQGKVLSGRPPAPLTQLQVEQRGQELWVLNTPVEGSNA
jgi:nitrite reductase/ring-hydroxylating ferredoxin subunit